jgi:Fe-Mn family superoxide dismutase
MPRKPKDELKPRGLQGLSDKLIDNHFDVLYKGYVNKLNEIEEGMKTVDTAAANATYSIIRELKKEEVFTTNAITLHEGYFENMSPGGNRPTGHILELIEREWGSYEKWEAEFRALGLSARGWVVLAFNWEDGHTHNYLTDIHSEAVWNCSPMMILDVYEHAYYLDYGAARKAYIDAFFANLDWGVVNKRIEDLRIMEFVRQTARA